MLSLRPIVISFGLAACLVATGCSPTMRAAYEPENVAQRPHPTMGRIRLGLQPLQDDRRKDARSKVLFAGDRETSVGGESMCVNAEEHYESERVARDVTQSFVEHFRAAQTFREVSSGTGAADYYVTWRLRRLYGAQQTSSAAAVGMAFGLIGALATAGTTTKGEVSIVISDIQIHDPSGRVVATVPDQLYGFNGELPADAHCWAVYSNVSDHLRKAGHRLLIAIANATSTVVR